MTASHRIVWLVSCLVNLFVLVSRKEGVQVVTMVLVQIVEFPFVLMKEIVLGVLHQMQMTKGQLLLNVLLIKLHLMQ